VGLSSCRGATVECGSQKRAKSRPGNSLVVRLATSKCSSRLPWASSGFRLKVSAPRKSGGAMIRYRLKAPIAAIYDKLGGGLVRVKIPAAAILTESAQPSGP